jgi:hypothetical protein
MASERAYENRAVVDDDQLAHQVVRELMDALPVGSYLAMSIPTDEIDPGPIAEIKLQKWRPDPDEVSAVSDREVNMYGGLARKSGVRGGGRST